MTDHIHTMIANHIGHLILDRPKVLNALSLEMIRTLTETLLSWRDNQDIHAVVIRSTSAQSFCAGGDIRFFYEIAKAAPKGGRTLLEDFFTEEYTLNYLIHHYPKPYIAFMDGIVMGGGMGIAQAGTSHRMRIVTERTRMAMPEVNIGLFPDVGGSFFLSHTPGRIGTYLGVTGTHIRADDALYAGLADIFVPTAQLPALIDLLTACGATQPVNAIRAFAAPFRSQAEPENSMLALHRAAIDRHFSHANVPAIIASLQQDNSPFSQTTLTAMQQSSPLMMCVTLEQIQRGAGMDMAECLCMERTMVHRCFEHGEVLEGIRAAIIDKDQLPAWQPATLEGVSTEMIAPFFHSAWPHQEHPLWNLR